MNDLTIEEYNLLEKIAPTLIVRGNVDSCLDLFPRCDVELVYGLLNNKSSEVDEYLSRLCS